MTRFTPLPFTLPMIVGDRFLLGGAPSRRPPCRISIIVVGSQFSEATTAFSVVSLLLNPRQRTELDTA
jgi:hypothetical protein